MTVSINGMTVEIKAKNLGEDKFNKAATQRILNYLSMVMTGIKRWDMMSIG